LESHADSSHRRMIRPALAESAMVAVLAESWTTAAQIHSATCHVDLLHRLMIRPELVESATVAGLA
jgi:hypothetical protein